MRVIIVSPSLDSSDNVSGISSVTRFIIDNNPHHDYVHFEQGKKDGEKGGVHRIGAILRGYREWRRLLRANQDAVVHYNFPLEKRGLVRDTPFMQAALRNGNRMVVHIHGGSLLTATHVPFLFRKVLDHVFSMQVPFIALSEKEAEALRARYHAKDVVSLPNCIDLSDAKAFERKYSNGSRPLILGYLGRIAKTKGMDYLLEACGELKKRGVPFQLRFAGAEEVERQYLPFFSNLLGEQFEYCGKISGERKNDFLRSLDVLVMPTFFEGLPMALLECMSYGVVPVVTPVGSIPTVVTDRQNGLFVNVKDIASIVDAIVFLHTDRERLVQMSVGARRYIYEHFDPDAYIGRLNQIYRRIYAET